MLGGLKPREEIFAMAKGQRKSNKEVRKPKANAPKKNNVSNPSTKPTGLGAILPSQDARRAER